MNQRAAYLLQILEKIGSPLMAAITEAAPGSGDAGSQDAQIMASLLAKTVQASIDLGHVMEVNPAEAMDDSLRVALAALAGPIVAGQYRKRGQIPEGAALRRVTGALQAVLTFSENFAPGPEIVQRLKELEARGQGVDPAQTQVQYVQAFVPVVEAIAEFPFGQAEQKLLMEVSGRLVKKSVELRETLLPGISDEQDQKRAELGVLRALAEVYSASHRAETAKVMAMGEAARSADLSMNSVWRNFDMRAAMLEALAGALVPVAGAQGGSASQSPAPPRQPEPPQPFTQPTAPSSPPAQVPPVQVSPVQQTPPASPEKNPMAMFAKPKTEAPAVVPSDAPPPFAPPAAAQSAAPPPPAVPEVPPSQGGAGESGSGEGQSGNRNPMSFFKKSE